MPQLKYNIIYHDSFTMKTSCSTVRYLYNHIEIQSKTFKLEAVLVHCF